MKILILSVLMLLSSPGCTPLHEIVAVHTAWRGAPTASRTLPEERIEGNYRAWGE